MFKIYSILFLFFLISPLVGQQKKNEYLLVWSDLNGLENISVQRTHIKIERFEVQKNKPKLIRTEKIVMESKIYRTIVASEKDFVVIRILRREGKILWDAERKMAMSLNTPEKIKQAKKYPDLEPYIDTITGGFVYRLNKHTGEVVATWALIEEEQQVNSKTQKENVKYKMEPLGKDPYKLSNAFTQIPNKAVPVGYEWNRRQMGSQTEDMKFAQVVPHMGRKSVAKITRKGTLLKDEEKIGMTEGIMYFDLEYKCTLESSSKKIFEQSRIVQDKNTTRNILEKITQESSIVLLYNNHDLITKGK